MKHKLAPAHFLNLLLLSLPSRLVALDRAVSKKQFPVRTAFATRLLPLVMLLLLTLPAVVRAQFNYTIDGTITITLYTGPGGEVVIPGTINGTPVTAIGDSAFYAQAGVTSVTMPGSLTSIGDSAFAFCLSLSNVTLGSSVTHIGQDAFANCTSLSAFTVDALNSVYTSVDGVLFNKSQTLLFQYPAGKVGSYTIPNSVTSIEYAAFSGCTSLTNLTIPNSVTGIGNYAFAGCTGLTNVAFGNGVAYIGQHAFRACTRLAGVTIPNSVTDIGQYAFAYCTRLTSLTLGSGVTSIGDSAFAGCTSLSTITVDALNSVFSSVAGVLFNKSQTLLIRCPEAKAGSYTIPGGVTRIGYSAFAECTNLTGVTIPNSVTNIGQYAFRNCTSLTSVTLGSGVTEIGDFAFAFCTSLTSVTIPNGVTTIPDWAFGYCTSLTSVTIGSGVTSIGDYAFTGCTSLSAITVDALNSIYSSLYGVLFNKSQTLLIQCPDGKVGSYTVPNSVTSIGYCAFADSTNLTGVTIPNSVTNIGDGTFSYCMSLTGVYFQGNVPEVIGFNLFVGADNATVYYLPGTTGWGTTFAGRPTALWQPRVQTGDASFGVRTNQFGFNITWASGMVVVVQAATDLGNPAWIPVGTNTLTSGSSYFSDPEWTNHPARFYRLRSP